MIKTPKSCLKKTLFRMDYVCQIYKLTSHKWVANIIVDNKVVLQFNTKTLWHLEIRVQNYMSFLGLPKKTP